MVCGHGAREAVVQPWEEGTTALVLISVHTGTNRLDRKCINCLVSDTASCDRTPKGGCCLFWFLSALKVLAKPTLAWEHLGLCVLYRSQRTPHTEGNPSV